MDWLSGVPKAPIPKELAEFDSDFDDLMRNNLPAFDPANRKTLAESLSHPFVSQRKASRQSGVKRPRATTSR